MRRREFIGVVGSTVAWPVALRAQQGRLRRVGIFMDLAESDVEGQARVAAFRRGMSELGWEEGRNVRFEYRWTAGDPVLMRRYAAALVDLGPEVIMNGGLPTWQPCSRKRERSRLYSPRSLIQLGAALWTAWRARAATSPD